MSTTSTEKYTTSSDDEASDEPDKKRPPVRTIITNYSMSDGEPDRKSKKQTSENGKRFLPDNEDRYEANNELHENDRPFKPLMTGKLDLKSAAVGYSQDVLIMADKIVTMLKSPDAFGNFSSQDIFKINERVVEILSLKFSKNISKGEQDFELLDAHIPPDRQVLSYKSLGTKRKFDISGSSGTTEKVFNIPESITTSMSDKKKRLQDLKKSSLSYTNDSDDHDEQDCNISRQPLAGPRKPKITQVEIMKPAPKNQLHSLSVAGHFPCSDQSQGHQTVKEDVKKVKSQRAENSREFIGDDSQLNKKKDIKTTPTNKLNSLESNGSLTNSIIDPFEEITVTSTPNGKSVILVAKRDQTSKADLVETGEDINNSVEKPTHIEHIETTVSDSEQKKIESDENSVLKNTDPAKMNESDNEKIDQVDSVKKFIQTDNNVPHTSSQTKTRKKVNNNVEKIEQPTRKMPRRQAKIKKRAE
ncbi:hypothetical protein HCN44_000318 [Aphidius gifuensis]|uniref:Uncharacterized protein n=1 Tax=Aphidius gifuensis TaxID=684658 RepID=A0A835CQS7_APHGI|nr:hypothetical protein HCN44_000318 [Aphidius gifuensis]